MKVGTLILCLAGLAVLLPLLAWIVLAALADPLSGPGGGTLLLVFTVGFTLWAAGRERRRRPPVISAPRR